MFGSNCKNKKGVGVYSERERESLVRRLHVKFSCYLHHYMPDYKEVDGGLSPHPVHHHHGGLITGANSGALPFQGLFTLVYFS